MLQVKKTAQKIFDLKEKLIKLLSIDGGLNSALNWQFILLRVG